MKIKTEVVTSDHGNQHIFKVTSKGLNAHEHDMYSFLGTRQHANALATKFGLKLRKGDKYLFSITNRIPSGDFVPITLERDFNNDFLINSPRSLKDWDFCKKYFIVALKKMAASLKKDNLILYLKIKKI